MESSRRGWLDHNKSLGWDDEKFPLTAARLDISRGYIDQDYFNGGVKFQTGARYPNDPASMVGQMPHSWLQGSEIRPHIHWFQNQNARPNWLLAIKIKNNGTEDIDETNYSNYTFRTFTEDVYTYTSGGLRQITTAPSIDMTGIHISAPIHVVLFRDNTNASGLFAGSDPYSGKALLYQFDFHYQKDSFGSWEEWNK